MIELPEARTIAKELKKVIMGKKIVEVAGNFTDHKFTFYYQDPNQYKKYLVNKRVTNMIDRNYYVGIEVEDYTVLFRDGANIRFYTSGKDKISKSKLFLKFEDGSFLNITTSMYSFICVFKTEEGMQEDKYYNLELHGVGALDKEFTFSYLKTLINDTTSKLSLKAFLATEQRILGIGNGVVQDILFNARMHPKRKLNTLKEDEIERLYQSVVHTLQDMVYGGGRDVEKNIFGEEGKYRTILSNKTYQKPCPVCHGEIKKENYLGGTIYYCSNCQK